jgi:hypothetical protein
MARGNHGLRSISTLNPSGDCSVPEGVNGPWLPRFWASRPAQSLQPIVDFSSGMAQDQEHVDDGWSATKSAIIADGPCEVSGIPMEAGVSPTRHLL